MAAMVAAAAVAAEVSAGIKIDVNAIEYDAGTKEFKALEVNHHNNDWESPISFSVSGEKAGATLHLSEAAIDGNDLGKFTKWNIWVKPIDMLTVNVGHWDTNLNQESISWGGTKSGIGSQGLTFTLAPTEGFTFDATFAPGYGKGWFRNADAVARENAAEAGDDWDTLTEAQKDAYIDAAKSVVEELGFKLQYSADFGTVNAIFDAKNTFKELKFGAGYKNTFDPLTIWVNALFATSDKENETEDFTNYVRVEAFQEAGLDALTVKAFEAFQFNTKTPDGADTKAKIDLNMKLYLGYKLGESTTAYLKVQDDDLLQDNFKMSINPGVEFKVGDCGIDAGVEVTAQEKIKFSVPVKFSMNF